MGLNASFRFLRSKLTHENAKQRSHSEIFSRSHTRATRESQIQPSSPWIFWRFIIITPRFPLILTLVLSLLLDVFLLFASVRPHFFFHFPYFLFPNANSQFIGFQERTPYFGPMKKRKTSSRIWHQPASFTRKRWDWWSARCSRPSPDWRISWAILSQLRFNFE